MTPRVSRLRYDQTPPDPSVSSAEIGVNPKWRQRASYGHNNFFLMGDNSKILFSFIEFSYPGNSEQQFLPSWGVPMGPRGPFGSFWA